MAENVASVLCYAGGWFTGLIFLFVDKRPAVRFHAAQSLVVFGALNIAELFLGLVAPRMIVDVIWIVSAGLWGFLMYKAYQGVQFRVPVAAELTGPLTAQLAKLTGGAPAAALSAAPEPFVPTKPAIPQIVRQVGAWTMEDATKALGAPANESSAGDDTKVSTYIYRDSSGELIEFDLGFNTQTNRLQLVALTPYDLTLDALKPRIGEATFVDGPKGMRIYDYSRLHACFAVDPAGKVKTAIFVPGADPALMEWLSSAASLPQKAPEPRASAAGSQA